VAGPPWAVVDGVGHGTRVAPGISARDREIAQATSDQLSTVSGQRTDVRRDPAVSSAPRENPPLAAENATHCARPIYRRPARPRPWGSPVPHRSGAIRSPRCRAGSIRPSADCRERERRAGVPPRCPLAERPSAPTGRIRRCNWRRSHIICFVGTFLQRNRPRSFRAEARDTSRAVGRRRSTCAWRDLRPP
jgi:hypothetical protein